MESPRPRPAAAPTTRMHRLQELYAFLRLYLYSLYLLTLQLFFFARSRGAVFEGDTLYGTTVILSGSSSGVGQSLCRLFQHYEACVVSLVKRNHDSPSNLYIETDLFDLDSLPQAVEDIRTLLNAIPKNARRKIVLLNAAGTLTPRDIYPVNLQAPSILAFLLADTLHAVVFLGSAVADCATLHRDFPLLVPSQIVRDRYPASKLLLHSVCEAISKNLSLRALVVHPGIVATNLYRSEPGIVGLCLRTTLPFLAWRPEMSAFRVLDILQQAQIFNRVPQFGADYWDARNMRMSKPPALALERRSPLGKLIVDQVWEELRELVDLINKFNKKEENKSQQRNERMETLAEEGTCEIKEGTGVGEIVQTDDGNEGNTEKGETKISQVINELVIEKKMSGATLLKEDDADGEIAD